MEQLFFQYYMFCNGCILHKKKNFADWNIIRSPEFKTGKVPEENKIPIELLDSLSGIPGFNKEAFEAVHHSGKQVTAIRINPFKKTSHKLFGFEIAGDVPWTKHGHYLSARPSFTFDPLFHGGAYYVQEASSMFLEQALQQTVDLDEPLMVLDLCAAPGGKSTHILSCLNSESVLVSNEVIRNRVNILAENITKWGAVNTIVTNNDPVDFSSFPAMFDVMVVDAPCSGSGLFRKDPGAISEWSLSNVQHCSMRQQRILADAWPALKPGGVLIYSTCSYSTSENERIADWLTETTAATSIPLQINPGWGIVETVSETHGNTGYRFYPYQLDGEGFYLACFRKPGVAEKLFSKAIKCQPDRKVVSIANHWLKEDHGLHFYQHKEQVFTMPSQTLQFFLFLQSKLNIRKAGIKLGDWARNEIIPDHALALSTVYQPAINALELDKQQAVQFLRRAAFTFEELPKGWLMVTHQALPLGWLKSLGSRINNYYPKDWRIRS